MGYNTVAFLLNDFMHYLKDSPYTIAFMLAHPPMGDSPTEKDFHKKTIELVARDHHEPVPHSQALEVLPTFHADCHKFFLAGGNCINELKFVRYRKTKEGKHTVTLELPSWWDPMRHR